MFGVLDAIKIGAGAVAGAALVALIGIPIAHTSGERAGRAALQSEIAAAALSAEKERVSYDAVLSRLSDRDLCIRALRARGMPVDACSGL